MRRSPLLHLASLVPLAALLTCSPKAWGAPLPVVQRGAELRTELVDTETKTSFRWHLAPSPDSYPRLLFEEMALITRHYVRIYQAVEEVPRGGGEPDSPRVEHKPIPGQTVRGEEFTRQVHQVVGPMANETFLVNGLVMKTDDAGVATDSTQSILALFEDLATTTATITARHQKYGVILLQVTRHILKRYAPNAGIPNGLGNTDVLASLGLDFEPKRSSEREGVTMAVTAPEKVECGQTFEVSLTVTNRGKTETSSFLGRTVSGKPWLHGRIFYIGSVPPGAKQKFVRQFTVPLDANGGLVYGGITYWDLLGTINGKGTMLELTVDAPKKAPAAPVPAPVPAPAPAP